MRTVEQLQTMVLLWSVLMAAIGMLTVAAIARAPRLRAQLPMLIPLLVGVYGVATAATVFGWNLGVLLDPIVQLPRSGPGRGLGFSLGVGVIVGVSGAWLSFKLERALLRVSPPRPRGRAGLPAGLGFDLPGRAESMAGVARAARRPWLFALISVVSATGEELLFRATMLAPLWRGEVTVFSLEILGLLATQAGLFGLLHLTFGWRTVVAKIFLGLALAAGALYAGLLLGALLPHLLFQGRVLAQFTTRPPRQEHAHVEFGNTR